LARAILLPESDTKQHNGKPQELGAQCLCKGARARCPERGRQSKRKTTRQRGQRAYDRAHRDRNACALLHGFSPRRVSRSVRSIICGGGTPAPLAPRYKRQASAKDCDPCAFPARSRRLIRIVGEPRNLSFSTVFRVGHDNLLNFSGNPFR
jgi:hypothetical protein